MGNMLFTRNKWVSRNVYYNWGQGTKEIWQGALGLSALMGNGVEKAIMNVNVIVEGPTYVNDLKILHKILHWRFFWGFLSTTLPLNLWMKL